MESIAKLECLTEENLLPCSCSRKESLVGYVVDVLDGNHLILDSIKVVDERAVSCRTEKERVSLCSERLVLYVYSHCVSSLVLECECDVVCNAILSLVCSLDLSISLLEEVLVLWRDSHDEVCCAVLISHVVLGLNKVLSERCADLAVSVLVELQDTLWLRSIAESLVSKGLCKD